jgi:hypothetical protein
MPLVRWSQGHTNQHSQLPIIIDTDGEDQDDGSSWSWRAAARASPRLWTEGQARRHWAVQVIGRVREFFQAKALHFDTNDDDVCGCRNPLEGTVVATFAPLGLRVKTLDLVGSTTMACASLPSWGVVVELWSFLVSFQWLWWQAMALLAFSCLFLICLLCKRFSSSPCIGLTVCGFIYKAEQKPISRNWYILCSVNFYGPRYFTRSFATYAFIYGAQEFSYSRKNLFFCKSGSFTG